MKIWPEVNSPASLRVAFELAMMPLVLIIALLSFQVEEITEAELDGKTVPVVIKSRHRVCVEGGELSIAHGTVVKSIFIGSRFGMASATRPASPELTQLYYKFFPQDAL
jgi:hypothetical protein